MDAITPEEFAYWMMLERIEPYGERADYFRAGIIAAAVRNAQRQKESDYLFKPQDFIPDFDKYDQVAQTPQQMLAMMDSRRPGKKWDRIKEASAPQTTEAIFAQMEIRRGRHSRNRPAREQARTD